MLRALDRFTKRLPSLIKLLAAVFVAIMATGAFVGVLLEKAGVCGCPLPAESLTWHYWLVLAAGLWLFWRVLRDIIWPRLFIEEWIPVHLGDGVGVLQNRAKMRYAFLTNHPSYVLVDVLAVIGPAVLMVMAWNEPCNANRIVLGLRAAVVLWGVIPLLRLVSWFVLGRGRDKLHAILPEDADASRKAALEWRICWMPVLNLWGIYLVIAALAVGIIRWEQHKEARDTPVLDATVYQAALAEPFQHKEQRVRVEGAVSGEVRQWRGGLRGLGARIQTQAGPVLVFCDALMADEFAALLAQPQAGRVSLVARVLPEISAADQRNFAWNPADFGTPPPGGWLMLQYVKP